MNTKHGVTEMENLKSFAMQGLEPNGGGGFWL